eukprot:TRINITY_DN329_c0_g1_i2.p1 TRINITY_DN329_c0_g1~~TRINITY_DN329_c0_g1_i2.p1  ORF type:complete len:218 (-),score=66.86 TRINITY_DN329_c0_g1_i2:68-721(-)
MAGFNTQDPISEEAITAISLAEILSHTDASEEQVKKDFGRDVVEFDGLQYRNMVQDDTDKGDMVGSSSSKMGSIDDFLTLWKSLGLPLALLSPFGRTALGGDSYECIGFALGHPKVIFSPQSDMASPLHIAWDPVRKEVRCETTMMYRAVPIDPMDEEFSMWASIRVLVIASSKEETWVCIDAIDPASPISMDERKKMRKSLYTKMDLPPPAMPLRR